MFTVWLPLPCWYCPDTGGESALTQFLMTEVSRLQRAMQDERRRRQQACSVAKEQVPFDYSRLKRVFCVDRVYEFWLTGVGLTGVCCLFSGGLVSAAATQGTREEKNGRASAQAAEREGAAEWGGQASPRPQLQPDGWDKRAQPGEEQRPAGQPRSADGGELAREPDVGHRKEMKLLTWLRVCECRWNGWKTRWSGWKVRRGGWNYESQRHFNRYGRLLSLLHRRRFM